MRLWFYKRPGALLVLLASLFLAAASAAGFMGLSVAAEGAIAASISHYRVIHVYPHDAKAFTQGLIYVDGRLYEGTGLKELSSLRAVDLESGLIEKIHHLPEVYFGEGITVFGDRMVQLTWKAHTGFVYDKHSFELLREFQYPGEGWGLTHDGRQLIMSDGTGTLRLLNPETFEQTGSIVVMDGETPVTGLNELEYIKGEIWANVYPTDRIAHIDPATGRVNSWLDLTGLLGAKPADQRVGILNGIAYDEEGDRLFVTGKRWPKLFEIRLASP